MSLLIIAERIEAALFGPGEWNHDFRASPYKMAVCRRWPFAIFLGRFMWSVKPGSNLTLRKGLKKGRQMNIVKLFITFDFEFLNRNTKTVQLPGKIPSAARVKYRHDA